MHVETDMYARMFVYCYVFKRLVLSGLKCTNVVLAGSHSRPIAEGRS